LRLASSSEISWLVFPSTFMRLISASTSVAIGRTYFFYGSVGFSSKLLGKSSHVATLWLSASLHLSAVVSQDPQDAITRRL
jgi:hypothetical protein